LTYRTGDRQSDAQKEIGANGVAIAADVTKSAELDAVFQTMAPLGSHHELIDDVPCWRHQTDSLAVRRDPLLLNLMQCSM
jgi:hypothetical protein